MANEIIFRQMAGESHAITIRNIDDSYKIWEPISAVFETFGTGARTLSDYGINAAETFGNGTFSVDMPAGISTSYRLLIEIYRRAGANLADDDVFAGSFELIWDGTSQEFVDAATIVTALMAKTGITAGGVWTFEKIMKVMVAWMTGDWKDKSGVSGTYQITDPDDGSTVILEITPGATTPQKTVTIL